MLDAEAQSASGRSLVCMTVQRLRGNAIGLTGKVALLSSDLDSPHLAATTPFGSYSFMQCRNRRIEGHPPSLELDHTWHIQRSLQEGEEKLIRSWGGKIRMVMRRTNGALQARSSSTTLSTADSSIHNDLMLMQERTRP